VIYNLTYKNGECEIMNKKAVFLTIISIILGVAIGIVIKHGGVTTQDGTTLPRMLNAIGRTGNGLFLWTAICTIITMLSKSKKLSAVNVFAFLGSMIIANYLYSFFVVEWFVLRVAIFWVVMLIPCSFLAYYIWDIKINKKIRNIKLKYIILAVGTIIMLYDMFLNNLIGSPTSAVIIMILYTLFVLSILKSSTAMED